MPPGLRNLFSAMYYAPPSFVKVDGVRHRMFPIETGVAQSCPASGSAWAIAVDPRIRHVASFIEHGDGALNYDLGYLGACAGDLDIKATLAPARAIGTLRQVSEPFAAAEELALLSL